MKRVYTTEEKINVFETGLEDLRLIRNDLREVGNKQAIKALRHAVKSVEGALRHARCLQAREFDKLVDVVRYDEPLPPTPGSSPEVTSSRFG
jgi:hypothetical protein